MSPNAAGDVQFAAQKAANGDWLERGARLGYAARALLYGIIAFTSLSVALGRGGEAQGSDGALKTLAGQPYGTVLLWAVTVGLAGYALWRLVQVFTTREDSVAKSIGKRVYYGIRAVLYGLLAWTAFSIVSNAGGGGGGGGSGRKTVVSRLLELPLGRWIVGLGAVAIIGYGLWQFYRAATHKWDEHLKTAMMSPGVKRAVDVAGVVGFIARGVVFGIIGGYLAWGAVTYDPDKAIGLDGALSALSDAGYGPWALGSIAIGLLGFAAFSAAEVRYRRIET